MIDGDRETVETLLDGAAPPTHVLARWAFEGGLASRDGTTRLPPVVDPVDAFRHVRGLASPVVLSVGRLRTLWTDLAARRPFLDLLRLGNSTGTTVVATGLPEEVPGDLVEWATTTKIVPLAADARARLEMAYESWLPPASASRAGTPARSTVSATCETEYVAAASIAAARHLASRAGVSGLSRQLAPVEGRVWPAAINRSEVAGLGRLKAWASTLRAGLAADAAALNLQPEHGVLITGTPDSGPAAVGAVIARELQWPLLRLSPARGEIDRDRNAGACLRWLEAASAALPAVVLLDDLESLGLIAEDGQPTAAFGEATTWLRAQERRALMVGVVGNAWLASDRLVEPGAFSRTFFLDLPDAAERDAALRAHLRVNRQQVDGVSLGPVIDATDAFTRGELGRLVAAAVGRRPFIDGTIVDALAEEAARVLPWALTRRGEALRLRQMALGRFDPAK